MTKKRATINGKMTLDYYDANRKKYVKDYRYRINRDSLRDSYFAATEHNELIITEFVNVVAELKNELELYTNKDKYSDKTIEVLKYADDIIAAYLDIVDENVRHEKYLKENHKELKNE